MQACLGCHERHTCDFDTSLRVACLLYSNISMCVGVDVCVCVCPSCACERADVCVFQTVLRVCIRSLVYRARARACMRHVIYRASMEKLCRRSKTV